MILKPHQILQQLGFNVPEEGVSINPDDAYLIQASLGLFGRTMDSARIPHPALVDLNEGLGGLASSRGLPRPHADEESISRLRTTVTLVVHGVLKPTA
jgi:hypothetical protein